MFLRCHKNGKLALRLRVAFSCVGICLFFSACKREERKFQVAPPLTEVATSIQLNEVVPGGTPSAPLTLTSGPMVNDYEENAYAISEGQNLFENFNCVGCHAHGGGDIGPPLDDRKWIYGFQPDQVYASIIQGRPNGMPAYGPRLTKNQVWQLVAYVRSFSGLASKSAASGRNDHMNTGLPPNSVGPAQPVNSSLPKNAEQPR